MKVELLKLLREKKDFISGQELSRSLGVSRTAIWKQMQALRKAGYRINAVPHRGYELCESPDVYSGEEIKSRLGTKWLGRELFFYETTDSTNLRAKEYGDNEGKAGALFISEFQERGRGRRGRDWECPTGAGIIFSVLLRPEILPEKAPSLTLVMALSAANAIRDTLHLDVRIKWPNDLLINKKKICGILTEMSCERDYIHHVVIGVGINVNQREIPPELNKSATSLFLESSKKTDRTALLNGVLERFEKNYEVFMETGDLIKLKDEYERLLYNVGKPVRITGKMDIKEGQREDNNDDFFEAEALGITNTGELMVRTSDGNTINVNAGEVSVRGLEGYAS
ncbi:MAG: biotin--[acetyl-CoA-carboxylase] ligase [Lachnospiraceae bacterium]|jgi:BirA family biotin operon repressor/biotin-[acetyl-CoA-carboxylase] ligase|nr:biotin--[acetyl-CoA-carboxylase] ligase [Lachnospiraceae bacterium]